MKTANIYDCSRKSSTLYSSYRELYTQETSHKPEMLNHSSGALPPGEHREGVGGPAGWPPDVSHEKGCASAALSCDHNRVMGTEGMGKASPSPTPRASVPGLRRLSPIGPEPTGAQLVSFQHEVYSCSLFLVSGFLDNSIHVVFQMPPHLRMKAFS